MKTYDQLMNESSNQFTVTVKEYDVSLDVQEMGVPNKPKTFETLSFDTKKAANKAKRELIKKYDMKKYHNNIVNFSKQIELLTNY